MWVSHMCRGFKTKEYLQNFIHAVLFAFQLLLILSYLLTILTYWLWVCSIFELFNTIIMINVIWKYSMCSLTFILQFSLSALHYLAYDIWTENHSITFQKIKTNKGKMKKQISRQRGALLMCECVLLNLHLSNAIIISIIQLIQKTNILN